MGFSFANKQVALFNRKQKILFRRRAVTAGYSDCAVLPVQGMTEELSCCLHLARGATDAGYLQAK